MKKYKFVAEYEIQASKKMIYPYLSSPIGLSEWFAEKVTVIDPMTVDIIWDKKSHVATITSKRKDLGIRFLFENEGGAGSNYLDFKLSYNELTETTFLTVTDYSEMQDEDELYALWDGFVEKLREQVGGQLSGQ